MNMENKNIYSLLEQFFSDGFTADCLSRITNVSKNTIVRCYDGEKLSQNESEELVHVINLLGMLYMCDTTDTYYLKEAVVSLEQYYNLPHIAIANYLGFSENEFDSFLRNPKGCSNSYDLSIKLMHLRFVLLQKQEGEIK